MNGSVCFSAKKATTGDILCEMRFHVPNNELEVYEEEQELAKAARRAEKKKAAGATEEEMKGEDKSEDSSSDDEGDADKVEMTAAKLLNQKIHKKVEIPEFAGEIVASI